MYKVFVCAVLLAAASAAPADHQATSYSSYNDNHNSVHHIESSSAPSKYAAPAHSYHAAPTQSYYASPVVAKVAIPAVAKLAVPAVTSYYNAPAQKYSSLSSHSSATPTSHSYASPASFSFAAPTSHVYTAPAALPVTKFAPATYAAPVTKYITSPVYSAHQEEYAPAKYEFAYSVEDPHTGDFHSQQEQRDGDHVVGQYSLHEADGTVRIVKYSDEGHGFNAVVERQGHPTEAPVNKKVVALAAPQYSHHY